MVRLVAVAVAALVAVSCSPPGGPPTPAGQEPADARPSAAELTRLDSTSWVTIYDPAKAWNGYTLTLYRARIPILIDMNGHIVHAWPKARVKSRIRLLRDGSLLAISLARSVVEYDWNGELVWQYDLEDKLPHHDVIRLENGNTMLLVRADGVPTDDLLEVDREGRVVWEWHSAEHLVEYFGRSSNPGDITHVNSVQELPPNPWYEAGDERFRPGNLMISARNLNTVFLVDRETGEAVWTYDEAMDNQHEALMIPPGFPGHGHVLIFNNRFRSFRRDRGSAVVEIDPTSGEVLWQYRDDSFFSATSGIEQPLANGNVMVSSSRGGRVFEVDRRREIVWQYTPPSRPHRPWRYGYDYCPQLAALDRPAQTAVRPDAGYRWVDPDAYRFARRGQRRKARVDGQTRRVLKKNNVCSRLFLPASATVQADYGLFPARIRRAGRDSYAVRFGMRLRVEESGEEVRLFDETAELAEGEPFRNTTVGLEAYALQRVELCVEAGELGGAGDSATEDFAFWGYPAVRPAGDGPGADEGEDELWGELTEEEFEARTKHLRALGYVN